MNSVFAFHAVVKSKNRTRRTGSNVTVVLPQLRVHGYPLKRACSDARNAHDAPNAHKSGETARTPPYSSTMGPSDHCAPAEAGSIQRMSIGVELSPAVSFVDSP